ncbi:MAG: hypothetical protein R3F14_21515 [Polyangiaceae bacterium]
MLAARLALILALATPACTVFDGVVPPGGAGGAGGDGGGGSGGESYVGEAQAVAICSKARTCDGLSDAIRLSTGVPVSRVSFSACLTWLTGPVAATERVGFAAQRLVLESIAAAEGCEQMLDEAPIRPAPAPCVTGCSADGRTLDDCARGARLDCKSALFDDGTGTAGCSVHEGIARCYSAECCVSVTDKSCRKPDEIAICPSGVADVCWDTPGGASGFHVTTHCDDVGISCAGISSSLVLEDVLLPCAFPTAECDGDVPSCADADTVRSCIGGAATLFECGPLGRECQSGDSAVACVEPGGCSLSDTACAGEDEIDACIGGVSRRLSCGAGRKCVPAGSGLSAGCQ